MSKLTCRTKAPSPNSKESQKAAEWNPQNRPGGLETPRSNQLVVVWLQQLKPVWCPLAPKICRGCPILWGGPGPHAPGYFLTTRRFPRGQKMKPKGKATPSSLRNWRGARKERVSTISKSDCLFPKNGVPPRRRGCRLFPKMTDYFLLAPKLVRRLYF